MRQATVAGWTGALAAVVSAAVLALMFYRASALSDGGAAMSLDPLGWLLLMAAIACLSLSLVLTVYGHFLRASAAHSAPVAEPSRPTESDGPARAEEPGPAEPVALDGDERRLYEMIEAAGGEILQMNLVSSGGFSKSKVTRLLDKLERKGLIRRERHGMTNKVILTGEP